MMLRRTRPPLSYLPRNDPPKGPYNAEMMTQFVRNYQTIARGFYDAVRLSHFHIELWLCPSCDKVSAVKKISETEINYCYWCKHGSTYNNILLGKP